MVTERAVELDVQGFYIFPLWWWLSLTLSPSHTFSQWLKIKQNDWWKNIRASTFEGVFMYRVEIGHSRPFLACGKWCGNLTQPSWACKVGRKFEILIFYPQLVQSEFIFYFLSQVCTLILYFSFILDITNKQITKQTKINIK
jgi:hypothetical protein